MVTVLGGKWPDSVTHCVDQAHFSIPLNLDYPSVQWEGDMEGGIGCIDTIGLLVELNQVIDAKCIQLMVESMLVPSQGQLGLTMLFSLI